MDPAIAKKAWLLAAGICAASPCGSGFTLVSNRIGSRLKNLIGKTLGEQLDTEKAAGRPVKLVRNRIAAKEVQMLFRELVKIHFDSDFPD
ncbi:hypothetical protein [Nostoc sp. CHAB 5715]|uniref:hypothetical protein n=1 Tax=Nostoc sp. CHAB 5715 TaxID=2780400 RepID=UPI001E4AB5D6|nr:hypothetical protein [Nostoc sp. CHAB 5715]MCC5625149.1 hypothetical protein [Nostoc sp. CHAB 5715]